MTGEILEKVSFLSNPAQLKHVRVLVRETGQQLGLSMTTIEEIVVGVNEACMNIIQHGYQNNLQGEINLEIISGSDELIIRISDNAPRVNPKLLVSRSLDDIRPGGLGIHFIHSVMDSVEYKAGDNNIGNTLELRKKMSPKESS